MIDGFGFWFLNQKGSAQCLKGLAGKMAQIHKQCKLGALYRKGSAFVYQLRKPLQKPFLFP